MLEITDPALSFHGLETSQHGALANSTAWTCHSRYRRGNREAEAGPGVEAGPRGGGGAAGRRRGLGRRRGRRAEAGPRDLRL